MTKQRYYYSTTTPLIQPKKHKYFTLYYFLMNTHFVKQKCTSNLQSHRKEIIMMETREKQKSPFIQIQESKN